MSGFSERNQKAWHEGQTKETENIFEINFQQEIDKAVQAGNYRLAVRLLFLRLLKNLAEKNIIQYQQDRTNFDYLMQLGNSVITKVFSGWPGIMNMRGMAGLLLTRIYLLLLKMILKF